MQYRILNLLCFHLALSKSINEESDKSYFLKDDVQYIENVHDLNYLPFFPERMKIERVEKLVANLHDKTEYVMRIRNLKKAFNHRLILEKVYRMIKFNQKAWLKLYIDMNTDLKKAKKQKLILKNIFFKLMNSAVFGNTMEYMKKKKKKHIKQQKCENRYVTTERRKYYLVSEPNYHTTKFFTEHLLAVEMKKNRDGYE